ncbi:MAG: hypothetical protein AAF985_07925 [Bacteroidota bacterium]
MKKLILLLFPAILVLSCKTETPKTTTDLEQIQECYLKYKEGILQGNGIAVMAQVSQKSLDYYSEMLRYAKGADSTAIADSGLTEKFTILQTRQRIESDVLVKMSDESYFIYVVEQGMIGKASVENVEIGDINIEGSSAKGDILIEGRKQEQFKFQFIKQEEGWKIDLLNLMVISSDGLKIEIERSPLSEQEYIMKVLEVITRKKRKDDLWKPRL